MGKKFEDLEEKYLNQDLQNQLGGTIIFTNYETFLKQKVGNLILISSIQELKHRNLNITKI